jgi:hypothetical protein
VLNRILGFISVGKQIKWKTDTEPSKQYLVSSKRKTFIGTVSHCFRRCNAGLAAINVLDINCACEMMGCLHCLICYIDIISACNT